MLRIHFSADDLLSTRVCVARAPVAEIVFAANAFWQRRGVGILDPWRHAVRSRLGSRGTRLIELVRSVRPTAELFTRANPDLRRCGAIRPTDDQRKITAAVHEFGRVAIHPYWPRLSVLLEIERVARGQMVLEDGIEGVLRGLHVGTKWSAPFLEIPGHADREVRLGSAGLIIVPSIFFAGPPKLHFSHGRRNGTPVLVYTAPIEVSPKQLWSPGPNSGEPLGALLGRTRAEALRVLLNNCTTGGLGQQLGISAAAASQHTSVLRNAGLITTRREKNAVSHSLTPLGLALLNREGFAEKQL